MTFYGQVYVLKTCRTAILEMHYNALDAGHKGIKKTIARITENYFFPGLRNVVKNYVKACATCQRTKNARHKPYSLL